MAKGRWLMGREVEGGVRPRNVGGGFVAAEDAIEAEDGIEVSLVLLREDWESCRRVLTTQMGLVTVPVAIPGAKATEEGGHEQLASYRSERREGG